jgi:hypothetical protein
LAARISARGQKSAPRRREMGWQTPSSLFRTEFNVTLSRRRRVSLLASEINLWKQRDSSHCPALPLPCPCPDRTRTGQGPCTCPVQDRCGQYRVASLLRMTFNPEFG